ncbi:phage terminase large subunit family protein [Shimia thalassica]|uniref:terminase gpA endonuclease subunit n=1 Tax=Shimia thalassica TaxID=1715693 RepID=UPI001C092771|nr:terminase gpA endonuclease subunit [Shimia thalassica]MBU2941061.1 phage terminase large subunit family protein [Shimia thalassica]MDO6504212.1 phage terminase large subunit family protein [Shimia thalassica]
MVQVSSGRMGQRLTFAPLPPLVTPAEILADALPLLDPPSRISVSDAAERNVRIQVQGAWQNFDRMTTPYMVEPSDTSQSRLFKMGAFLGPSQSGKTKMLETVAFHAVTSDPGPVLIIHMTRQSRDVWVEEKLDPSILNSPAIFDRIGKGRDDSTFSRKRFRGMRLTIGYPTSTILSGGTYRMVLITDIDHIPLVMGGKDNPEGSPGRMALQRIKSYLSRGFVLLEGSPAYPSLDPNYKPSKEEPHKLPPVEGGIASYYNQGTRGRWFWECKDCGEEFEPCFDQLHYNAELSPGAAGEMAEMECPHCHTLVAHRHKMEFNRDALFGRGGWRHEAEDGSLCELHDEAIRRTSTASWALNGAAATFANWNELVTNWLEAKKRLEDLGDHVELAGVTYTEIGLPYQAEKDEDENELSLQFLKDHLQDAVRGVAPEWTRFVVVSIDVQGSYFPVQITAYGEGNRSQVVDRVDLTVPPEGAPNAAADEHGNRRRLDPGRYLEDWDVLKPYANLVVPVAGANYGLRPIGTVVDFHGGPGVSDNAEAFWKARKKAGQGSRWFLSRGQGGWKTPFRVKYEAPERGSNGKTARSIMLLTIATDRLKDTMHSALKKASGGVGALYLPSWMKDDDNMLGEFIAEERSGRTGWSKKPGVVRNEGTDVTVQSRALAEHKKLLKIDWAAPPKWATGGPENENAVLLEDLQTNDMGEVEAPKPKRRSRRAGRLF